MTQRMNYYAAAPEGLKALLSVEAYLKAGGIEAPLLHLVKTPASRS